MINPFRKIRRKLADDNKSVQYARYAIGEIILVVIGILIALQINNWNEDRINKIEERKLLNSLVSEFSENLSVLKYDLKRIDAVLSANKAAQEIDENSIDKHSAAEIDSLLNVSMRHPTWNPSLFILEELKSSGKLTDLHNKQLTKLLYQWYSFYDDYLEDIKFSENSWFNFNSFMNEFGNKNDLFRNNLKSSGKNKELFKSQHFKNLLFNLKASASLRRKGFKKAEKIIEAIILEAEAGS